MAHILCVLNKRTLKENNEVVVDIRVHEEKDK